MSTYPDWWSRALEYEDLPAEDRREIDGWLAERQDLLEILTRLRAIESGGGPRGSFPDLASLQVPQELRAEADASLRMLRRRIAERRAVAETVPGPAAAGEEGPSWMDRLRAFLSPPVLVPVGAVAVILLVMQLSQRGPAGSAVGELMAHPASQTRGVDSSEDRNRAGDRTWKTGDAFFLQCSIERPVVPVLFHVDPQGVVTLLHPEDPADLPAVFPGGRPLEFPAAAGDEEWVLEGDPGVETFLLATSPEAPDLGALMRRVDRIGPGSRERVVRDLEALLGGEFEDVRRTEIEHVP